MKKRTFSIILSVIALGLCACDSGEPVIDPPDGTGPADPVHVHTYSETWSYNRDYHWRAADCGDDELTDYAPHLWSDPVTEWDNFCEEEGAEIYRCFCGAERRIPLAPLGHAFSEEWSHDERFHWHASTCGHDVAADREEHDFDDDLICKECGFELVAREDQLRFELREGTYTVLGCTHNAVYVSIPAYHDGIRVTAVGESAFEGSPDLRYLELAEGIERLEPSAFSGCTALESVSLPSTLKSVGRYTFADCVSLSRLELGEGTEELGDYAFSNCMALTEVFLPDGLLSLGTGVFGNCRELLSLRLPEEIESLPSELAQNCVSLKEIELPAGLRGIGELAFYHCDSLSSVRIPDGVEELGSYAFASCEGLREIVIGEGAEILGSGIFSKCGCLTEIDLPKSIKIIDSWAFEGCSSLERVGLPDGLTEVRAYAFEGCSSLTELVLPQGVTSLGLGVFSECEKLSSLTIKGALERVCGYALYHTALSEFTVPSSVRTIESYAFYGMEKLERLYFERTEGWRGFTLAQMNDPLFADEADLPRMQPYFTPDSDVLSDPVRAAGVLPAEPYNEGYCQYFFICI